MRVISGDSELVIATERLELNPIRRDDADRLFAILSDSALYAYTGQIFPTSRAALRELFTEREKRRSPDGGELWLNWAMNKRSPGEAVGYMQATVTALGAHTAWVVGTKWQGLGYATEAAKAVVKWLWSIGVERVQANIHPAHVASRRVASKVGFRLTSEVIDGENVWTMSGR